LFPAAISDGLSAYGGVPESKLRLIANAVAISSEITPASVPLDTPFVVATVGRLVKWKGISGLIEAVASLSDVGLILIGDGPERAALSARAQELDVCHKVLFVGKHPRHESLALMASSHLFVLNSTYEGLPHILLEAMSLGIPVVATAVGGTPEIIVDGENGLLVPSGDVPALIQAIQMIKDDERLRTRLIDAGRSLVRTQYDAGTMVEAAEGVLEESLSRAKANHQSRIEK